MATARSYLTLEEFLRLPEEEPPLEYEDGRITQKVSPQNQHAVVQGELTTWINAHARPRKIAFAFPELRTTHANSSLVPDIAVLRWARIPRNASGEVANDTSLVPDIAVEITSPEQSAASLVAKCRRYLANGADRALLVDLQARTVRWFGQGRQEQVLRGADRIDLDLVLPGFELTVDQVFAALKVD